MDASALDAVAEWRRRLAPWLQALRETHIHADLSALPTADELESVWSGLILPRQERGQPKTWAEALELLELLARVDQLSAWTLLFELISQPPFAAQCVRVLLFSGTRTATTPALPRFRFIFYEEGFDPIDGKADSLRELAAPPQCEPTAGYENMKALLLQRWSQIHDERSFDRATCGRVKFAVCCLCENADDEEMEFILEEMIGVAFAFTRAVTRRIEEAKEHADGTENHEHGQFELDSLDIYLGGEVVVSTTVLKKLLELSRYRVRVSTLSITNFAYERLYPDDARRFLRAYLEPGEEDEDFEEEDQQPGFRGVEKLEVCSTNVDLAAMEVLAVATAHSRTLRMVKIDPSAGEEVDQRRDAWWPWMAYALFSRQTTHNILHASLDVSTLRLNNIQAVRNVICSEDPLRAVFRSRTERLTAHMMSGNQVNDQDDSLGPTMGVLVNQMACFCLGHHDVPRSTDGRTVVAVFGADPEGYYRVLRDQAHEDFVEIIRPDRGVCWIHRDMVVGQCVIPSRPCHPIRHLTLKYVQEESLEATIELLELIGGPIERVALTDIVRPLGNVLFDALFAHCPNLVRLDLELVDVESVEWLWRQPSDRFKLEALSLSSLTVHDQSRWQRLFEVLGDTTHPLAQSLRRLRFNLRGTQTTQPKSTLELQDDMLKHVLVMLTRNFRLQHCELLQCPSSVFDKYNQLFQSHDDEPVCVEEGPLPPAKTLAFLSVLTPPSTQSKKTRQQQQQYAPIARYKLTPEPVLSILAFAARPRRRVCQLYRESEFGAECLMSD